MRVIHAHHEKFDLINKEKRRVAFTAKNFGICGTAHH